MSDAEETARWLTARCVCTHARLHHKLENDAGERSCEECDCPNFRLPVES